VLSPSTRHDVTLFAAGVNPAGEAGKIELHEAIDSGGVEGGFKVEMNFFARTIASARSARAQKDSAEDTTKFSRSAHVGLDTEQNAAGAASALTRRYANRQLKFDLRFIFEPRDAVLVNLYNLEECTGRIPQCRNLAAMLLNLPRMLLDLTRVFLTFAQQKFGRLRQRLVALCESI
jgi:hypothetical protein